MAPDDPRPGRPRRLHYAWVIMGMGVLVVFGALGLARFGYGIVLPSMQRGLGFSNAAAGALATADLVGYAAMSVLGGALASRYGPRRIIAIGLTLAGVGMVLTGFAQGLLGAAVPRLLTGIGSGMSNVPVMGLLSAWFATSRRGFAAGVVVTGSSFALIILGPLVPRLLAAGGPNAWRGVWFLYGAVALVLALGSYLVLRNRPAEKGLDPLGQAPHHADAGGRPVLIKNPPLPRPSWGLVYRSSAVWHLGLVYSAFGFSYVIYMTFFVKYLVGEGYSQTAAGRLLMVLGWSSLLCGVMWGVVSDIIGRKWGLMLVYLIQATAFTLFGLSSHGVGFTASAVLFGLTAWSIPAIVAATCGDVLGPQMAPAALGFLTLFFAVGQVLGPATAGVIADASSGFGPAFLLAGLVALLGAVGAAFLRPASSLTPEIQALPET